MHLSLQFHLPCCFSLCVQLTRAGRPLSIMHVFFLTGISPCTLMPWSALPGGESESESSGALTPALTCSPRCAPCGARAQALNEDRRPYTQPGALAFSLKHKMFSSMLPSCFVLNCILQTTEMHSDLHLLVLFFPESWNR